MITEMVFKIGAMIGCAIDVINIVDGIIPPLLDFIPIGRVILESLSCQLTVTIGICQVILLAFQPELEHMREAERALQTNSVCILLN